MGFVATQLLSFHIQTAPSSVCACAQRGVFIAIHMFYRSWDAVRWVHREGFQSLLKLYDPDKYLIVSFQRNTLLQLVWGSTAAGSQTIVLWPSFL